MRYSGADTTKYVNAPEPVDVTVTVKGQQWRGQVIGWRGERVDVTWRTAAGMTQVGFVDAAQVERVAHP